VFFFLKNIKNLYIYNFQKKKPQFNFVKFGH
jgi:hypothetical protein